MNYEGKLYGKIGGIYVEVTIEDEKKKSWNEAIEAAADLSNSSDYVEVHKREILKLKK